jgi:hypothetical protein
MPTKKYQPEHIMTPLRQVEVMSPMGRQRRRPAGKGASPSRRSTAAQAVWWLEAGQAKRLKALELSSRTSRKPQRVSKKLHGATSCRDLHSATTSGWPERKITHDEAARAEKFRRQILPRLSTAPIWRGATTLHLLL